MFGFFTKEKKKLAIENDKRLKALQKDVKEHRFVIRPVPNGNFTLSERYVSEKYSEIHTFYIGTYTSLKKAKADAKHLSKESILL